MILDAETIRNLVARVARRAETTDAWSAARAVVAQLPEDMVRKVAAEHLARSYFRVEHAVDGGPKAVRAAVKTPRRRQPSTPLPPVEEPFSAWDAIARLIVDYTATIKAQWTAELLAETFTLPDGTEVTWGEATAEQHTAAAEDWTIEAHAAIGHAARHQQAADTLRAVGAPCLAHLTEVAA